MHNAFQGFQALDKIRAIRYYSTYRQKHGGDIRITGILPKGAMKPDNLEHKLRILAGKVKDGRVTHEVKVRESGDMVVKIRAVGVNDKKYRFSCEKIRDAAQEQAQDSQWKVSHQHEIKILRKPEQEAQRE